MLFCWAIAHEAENAAISRQAFEEALMMAIINASGNFMFRKAEYDAVPCNDGHWPFRAL